MTKTQTSKKICVPNYKEVLEDLRYKLSFNGKNYRTGALYRQGKNSTSLVVDEWGFYDFGAGVKGSIVDLVSMTTGIDNDEFQHLIELKERNPSVNIVNYLTTPKYYSNDLLARLSKDYSYFESRGISSEVQKQFECGLARQGKLRNKIVFPIRDLNRKIVGFAGRHNGEHKPTDPFPKWQILGLKRFFNYNFILSNDVVQKSGVIILVESIGDLLSFYEAGIRNVACCFGLKVHKALLKYIIQNRLQVVVSLNNDERQNGNIAAEKTATMLSKYMLAENIQIALPELNDWNVELNVNGKDKLTNFYNNLQFK